MTGWLVKLKRTGFETVLSGPHVDRSIALWRATELNQQYQTDEYYVEEYDSRKQGGYNVN